MDGNVSPSGQRSPRAVVHFQVELQVIVDVHVLRVCVSMCVCAAGSRNYHVVRGRWTLPPPPSTPQALLTGPKPRLKLKLKPKRVFRPTTTKLMYSPSTHTYAHTDAHPAVYICI